MTCRCGEDSYAGDAVLAADEAGDVFLAAHDAGDTVLAADDAVDAVFSFPQIEPINLCLVTFIF